MKISFLIALHNEEKRIAPVLKNLLKLPYDDYEILLGLDGCDDGTEDIIKHYCTISKKIKYFTTHLRNGKADVINRLAKQAKGDILVIHDADWVFQIKDVRDIHNLVKQFKNPEVGGIAEVYPVQYPLRKEAGLLERGVMLQNKLWMDYSKEKGLPLLVNILRRCLYKHNKTLADDFERYNFIINAGYKVVVDGKLPRMVTAGEEYTWKGLIRQKERTARARKQISYHLGLGFYLYALKEMIRLSFKDFIALSIVNLAFILGTINSNIKPTLTTQEAWEMRAR